LPAFELLGYILSMKGCGIAAEIPAGQRGLQRKARTIVEIFDVVDSPKF
jgi:hypothetical protein